MRYVHFYCNVAVSFPPLSLTKVTRICNFVHKRMLTLDCFAVQHRQQTKIIKLIGLKFVRNRLVDFFYVKLALELLKVDLTNLNQFWGMKKQLYLWECQRVAIAN